MEINPTDRIPMMSQDIRGINNRPETNVVKIYHEMTDDFGNIIRDQRTFNMKDAKDREYLGGIRNAPAYLSKNFNDIMQHIS